MSVKCFAPTNYYYEYFLPVSNEEQRQREYENVKVEKSYDFLGIWLLISFHPGYTICDLISVEERNVFWNFTLIGVIMVENKFDQNVECIYISKT